MINKSQCDVIFFAAHKCKKTFAEQNGFKGQDFLSLVGEIKKIQYREEESIVFIDDELARHVASELVHHSKLRDVEECKSEIDYCILENQQHVKRLRARNAS